MMRVTQTIRTDNSDRPGNCLAAAVATWLELELEDVPHFLEHGMTFGDSLDPSQPSETHYWWALLVGFMAGHGYWATELGTIDDADPGEVLFVMGMSPRGVCHQVLYRDGELWHDPHPSRDGVLDVREVIAWRRVTHNHDPKGTH